MMKVKTLENTKETMDITPTPKILGLLENLAVEPWRCVAELTDNALDDFNKNNNEHGKVRVECVNKQLIISDPKIMMGKPVVVDTRITVELILEKLGAGETIEQLLEAHPRLTREAVLAALAFAAEALRADVLYPTPEV